VIRLTEEERTNLEFEERRQCLACIQRRWHTDAEWLAHPRRKTGTEYQIRKTRPEVEE
jgi:hypothetical protein